MMKLISLLSISILIEYGQSLEAFDPWTITNKTHCSPTMNSCHFELHATSTMTMFYRQLYRVVATVDGILHKYDDETKIFSPSKIITADGYPKLVYVFNHSLPGPNLHVYKGQRIFVEIFNDLATESLSVHFHGIRQYRTGQSDGIGRLTQLSILPGSSFIHEFDAIDEGTFWYHSHVNTQTSMGLLGGFIVHPKEKENENEIIREFVVILKDWQHFYTGEQHQTLVESSQFYPNSLESLTSSGTIDYYQSVDGSYSAEALITSILINGRGQYIDPRTNESSTTPFEHLIVDRSNSQYRLRLINGGSAFSMKFSIDQHKLEVIATDGVPLESSIIVDEIIIGLGERYDVLINISNQTNENAWWIRVDTMDKNNNSRWNSKAILQFPNQTLFEAKTRKKICSLEDVCVVLNCPFDQYGSDKTRSCLTMKDIQTKNDHIDEDLISDKIKLNINQSISLTVVESEDDKSGYESMNYISMKYPKMSKPILYQSKLARQMNICLNKTSSNVDELGQKCYHHILVNRNDLIEFLVVNLDTDQHPMHLHGFYFHIIEQGLPILNKTTGLFSQSNPNVECDENGINCQCLNCSSNTRLVKDTMIVPSGGYMRIRFRANNPGVWLFHCHTETHLDRGMALAIHVDEDEIDRILGSNSTKIHFYRSFIFFTFFILFSFKI